MSEASDQYEVTTVAQMIEIYRSLPKEQGDLMLKEVTDAIRYAANVHEVLGLIGCNVSCQLITWINDTEGTKTVNFMAGVREEPFVSFKITPKPGPSSEDAT
jgi:hypothetical protein